MKIEITDREFHTILAALRLWQVQRDRDIPGGLLDLAEDEGSYARLSYEETDSLCERINVG